MQPQQPRGYQRSLSNIYPTDVQYHFPNLDYKNPSNNKALIGLIPSSTSTLGSLQQQTTSYPPQEIPYSNCSLFSNYGYQPKRQLSSMLPPPISYQEYLKKGGSDVIFPTTYHDKYAQQSYSNKAAIDSPLEWGNIKLIEMISTFQSSLYLQDIITTAKCEDITLLINKVYWLRRTLTNGKPYFFTDMGIMYYQRL